MTASFIHRGGRWALALLAALGLAAAAVAMATPASAHAEEPDALAGTPELRPDARVGYYLWRDEDGINLRTHGSRDPLHFVAVLRTDGVFRDVEGVANERRDGFRVIDHGHTLILDVQTSGGLDGVNFRVHGGTWLGFDLEIDGRQAPTDHIFLGSMRSHPDSNPWRVQLGDGRPQ